MNNYSDNQIFRLEERTLKDLYTLSVKKSEIDKLKRELDDIEKDSFEILFSLKDPIYEIIKRKDMVNLREIIEQHQFSELIDSSKKALESTNRDFIERMESRVRSFEQNIMKLSDLYGIREYRLVEDLIDIEEKLKLEHEYGDKKPFSSILIILMWNSRILRDRLSSRAVWLSYKKP